MKRITFYLRFVEQLARLGSISQAEVVQCVSFGCSASQEEGWLHSRICHIPKYSGLFLSNPSVILSHGYPQISPLTLPAEKTGGKFMAYLEQWYRTSAPSFLLVFSPSCYLTCFHSFLPVCNLSHLVCYVYVSFEAP